MISKTRFCLQILITTVCLTVILMSYIFDKPALFSLHLKIWNLSSELYMSNNLEQDYISVKEGYLVQSPSCHIPDINPFHKTIQTFIKHVKPIKCSKLPPLTRLSHDKLIYDNKIALLYSKEHEIGCCFVVIKREKFQSDDSDDNDPLEIFDDKLSLGLCIKFNKTVKLKDDEEFILVRCYSIEKDKKELYMNVHARVVTKSIINHKLKNTSKENKLSVLMIGIDSVSRLNLLRTMPKTVSFLKENDFLEFKGYNKVADDTFPNLVAILTGMRVEQINKNNWKDKNELLDNYPFIWYNASALGYITAYAEDTPSIATFNYCKGGFKNSPTDYYFRSFLVATELFINSRSYDGLNICVGSELAGNIILNYAKDFVFHFNDSLYFSLFWLNSFSHNDLNTPSIMDNNILNFFNNIFKKKDTINKTAIIFLSDHGIRFTKFRETYYGWLEERLPFLHVWLPEWYRKKYKERYNNLILNSNKLTSPYDLHLTLNDLMSIKNNENGKNYISKACHTCVSLFKQVPWNRNCEEAGITEHFCTCSEYRTLVINNDFIKMIGNFAVNQINTILLATFNLTTDNKKCAHLQLKRVIKIKYKVYNESVKHNDKLIVFETFPGAALFEATVRYDKKQLHLIDTISRINVYSNQSYCIENSYLRKYCFCIKDVNKTIE